MYSLLADSVGNHVSETLMVWKWFPKAAQLMLIRLFYIATPFLLMAMRGTNVRPVFMQWNVVLVIFATMDLSHHYPQQATQVLVLQVFF